MAHAHQIEGKSKILAESVTQLADRMSDGLGLLAGLQRRLLILTAPDAALTAATFTAAPGTPDAKLGESMKAHAAAADVMDQSAQLMAALGQGAEADELDKRHSMFAAAADGLKALEPAGDVSAEEKDVDTDIKDAQLADPKTARQAKLDVIGEKAFGALGMVGKVAARSTVGKISAVVHIVGEHVEKAVRLKKGQAALAELAPEIAPDFASLVEVLTEGAPEFAAAADEMIGRAVEWSNDHRPEASDPARLSYDLHVAAMIADARTLHQSFDACTQGLPSVMPAFKEIQGILKGESEDDGSSHELTKKVGADLHALSKVRVF